MKEKLEKAKQFIKDKPFVKKALITALVYLGIKIIYSNFAWDSLRAKVPAINRMFYSSSLSVKYWFNRGRNPNSTAEEEELLPKDGILQVKSLKVVEKSIASSINSSGVIEPYDKVEIYSKVSGRINNIYVIEGEKVAQNKVLVQIETSAQEIELMKQKAALASSVAKHNLALEKYNLAKKKVEVRLNEADKKIATYEKAKAELKRINDHYSSKKKLLKAGAIPLEEFKNIELEVKSKESAYKIAKRDFNISMVGIRNEDISKSGNTVPLNKAAKIEILKDINTKIEKSEVNVAAKDVEQHRANVKTTNMLIQEATLRSPINGIVSKKHKSRGVLINSGGMDSQTILTLVQIDKVYAAFHINEFDTSLIKEDMPVTVKSDIYPDVEFEGRVKVISPEVDQKTHTAKVKVILKNKGLRLKPGMFIRATVNREKEKKGILLPAKVIRTVENNMAEVYALKPGKKPGMYGVFQIRVTLGKKHNEEIEITSGLEAGQIIATNHLSRLKDGMKVKLELKK
ncbi:MAG: efflux RND transporter periplasmic adaptor subunit [Spirochaetota bacterium]